MKHTTNLFFRYSLAIIALCFWTTAKAQNHQVRYTIDTNCNVTVLLVDSTTGAPLSNNPPYIINVGTQHYNNNNIGIGYFSLPSSTTPAIISVIDGSQNTYYPSSQSLRCSNIPINNSYVKDSTTSNATNCNTCDGGASVDIINVIGSAPFYFSIDGSSFVQKSTATIQYNSLCTGQHNIVAYDSQNNYYSGTVSISCSGQSLPVAACYPYLSFDLGNSNFVSITANVLDTLSSNPNPHLLLDNQNGLQSSILLGCTDLGYHYIPLIVFDSLSGAADTCISFIQITDTLNNCNNYAYLVTDSLRNADSCSSCNGFYNFYNVAFLHNNQQATPPYSFVWSDGESRSTRNDLCPNTPYQLRIYDANGNVYTRQVRVGCDSLPTGSCFDSTLTTNNINCPSAYAPVCGCNNITYNNACEAEFVYGISQWTTGVCNNMNSFLQVIQNITPSSFGCDTNIISCNGSIVITALGGQSPYTIRWHNSFFGFNPQGVCTGNYTFTVYDANNDSVTQVVHVAMTDCVWPGDTDNNTTANNFDLLPIALTYGDIGISRINQSTTWQGLQSLDWFNGNPINNLLNSRYIDCDGNSLIDSLDVDVIKQNYAQSYQRSAQSLLGTSPFFVKSSAGAVTGDSISLEIHLGDNINPASNVYALAFTIYYDSSLVKDGKTSIDFSSSWLGNNLISVQQNFHSQGKIEVAVGRKNKTAISGSGIIGRVSFTIRDDLVMGRAVRTDTSSIDLTISNIRIIDEHNQVKGSNPQTGIVEFSERIMPNQKRSKIATRIFVYPNPTKGLLNISSNNSPLEKISIYNNLGKCIYQYSPYSLNYRLDTEALAAGVYILSVQTQTGISTQKITVLK